MTCILQTTWHLLVWWKIYDVIQGEEEDIGEKRKRFPSVVFPLWAPKIISSPPGSKDERLHGVTPQTSGCKL